MKSKRREMWRIQQMLLATGLALLIAVPAFAQVPVDEYGNPVAPLVEGATPESFDDEELPALSVGELEDVVGPVALYPDDLLAIVLPASTYPLQIVQAARFLEQLETDPTLKPDEDWDESVTALLNYPEVVKLMNDDIDWTWRLGEAVVAQQADVIAAIEVFRDKAYAAGNLKSDEYQNVSNEDGVIEIEPANNDIIYVPYYEPETVVIYQPRPVYHYYPQAYPVYNYPYPYGYSFGSNFFWGVTTAFTIGWMTDHLHVYHHSYWGHPYYGHNYQSRFYYRRPSITHFNHYYVNNSQNHWNYRYRDGDYWRPRRRGGARPGQDTRRVHYYRDRTRDDWSHRGSSRSTNSSGSLASNRSNDRQRSRNDRASDTGGRQASNQDRSSRNRNTAAPAASKAISFKPRDARARAEVERRRARASEDLNRNTQRRTTLAANNTRPNSSRTANRGAAEPRSHDRNRSSNSASRERGQQVATNTPRRQVQPSARPRLASNPTTQRSPSRSQPQRSAPQRSTPQPRESNKSSSGNKRQSERRSSKSESRGGSARSESQRRRH